MTKRISQANTVVVPVAEAPHAGVQAAAVKAVVVPAGAEVVAAKADVVIEDKVVAVVGEPVVALAAPAPLAMVAGQDTPASGDPTATTTPPPADDGDDQDMTPYIVGGALLAGGILAIALSSGDNNSSPTPSPTPTPTPTPTNAVTFSSAATASTAENATAGQGSGVVVIDVNAAAAATGGAITYTLGGTDAAAFNINATTGEVRFNVSPNFEAKSSYSITVTAASAANGTTPAATASQTIAVTVTNVNEAPSFASSTATATVVENAAVATPVFTPVAATDPDANTTLTYTLGGTDAAAFTISATTGAVSLRAPADFETKSSYVFTVTATDNATPALSSAAQTVTLNVTNVNESPVFTSSATPRIDENVAAGTTVYTAITTDPESNTRTYTLSGTDATAFTINATTGVVSINASPDFETKTSYSFVVTATDNGSPVATATQAVTLGINDIAVEGTRLDGAGISANTQLTYSAANGNVTFLETGAVGNLSTITGFTAGDIIQTDVATSNYSFTSNGTTLIISYTNNGVNSRIDLPNSVSSNAGVFNEASAELALGFDFFRSSAPPAAAATLSLDTAVSPINATTNAFTFTDAVGTPSISVINGFTADDRVVLTGATTGAAFTSNNDDLIISFSSGGIVSRITINDVVSPSAGIFDEASAEAAVGFDFFRYG